ncbi:hypothetical protein BJY00DRAFT_326822 [Aspergillus carlsbadensis]|nr:hypothetical protein BJY00DRAFT_326822 [Aspergillus carlsbadensis]
MAVLRPQSRICPETTKMNLAESMVQMPEASPSSIPPASELVFDFDLRESPSKFHDRECRIRLLDAFPTAHAIDFDDRLLVCHFRQLPPKPWPQRVAGVPCYLTDHDNDLGPFVSLIRRRDFSRIQLSQHLDLRDNEAAVDLVLDLVRDFFMQRAIPVTEIQFWSRLLIIVLEGGNDESFFRHGRLPQSVAQCNCFYLFDEEMARPSWRSLSTVQRQSASVSGDPIDDTSHRLLRSGVILSSGQQSSQAGSEILTSSGILLRNHLGNEYLTVAAHGFPTEMDGAVYQPNHPGRIIGQVSQRFPHTDVALVKLDDAVQFRSEASENEQVIPGRPAKFTGLSRAAETKLGDDTFLDSPFSGFLRGTTLCHADLRVPTTDDPVAPRQHTWVRCQWHYMGQGSSRAMSGGMCGSAVWNKEHKVQGLFRYAPTSGLFVDFCMTVAVDDLLSKGYAVGGIV